MATTIGCTLLAPFVPGCTALVAGGGLLEDAAAAGARGLETRAGGSGGLFSGLGDAVHDVGEETNRGLSTVLYTTIAVGAIIALLVFALVAFMIWHEFFR